MYREPPVMRRKVGLKSMVWTRRKKETSNQKRMKQQEFRKMRNLQDILKCSNIQIIGIPEGEEEEQKIETLFKQIMEKFPKLVKEIDFQEVQEAQRVPKTLDPRRNTPTHIIITLPEIKDKERILEAAREKKRETLQRSSHKTSSSFLKRNFAGKDKLESIQSDE